jgi:G3E family GTPase
MIPIYLITGFLGSGKTTLLAELAKEADRSGKRVVFLVNEISKFDVDGRRILELGRETVVIPGGSIFCTCVVTQFIDHLNDLPLRFGDSPIDAVVIEASGVANPAAIDKLLAETQLDKIFQVARVISMADPQTLPKILKTLPAAREQLAASDLILINKCDLVSAENIEICKGLINELAPKTTCYCVHHGKSPEPLLLPVVRSSLQGDLITCADPSSEHSRYALESLISIRQLRLIFAQHEDYIYRAKGIVLCREGWQEVDYSGGRLDYRPAKEGGVGELVVITKPSPPPEIEADFVALNSLSSRSGALGKTPCCAGPGCC